jgi:hypothetical protein
MIPLRTEYYGKLLEESKKLNHLVVQRYLINTGWEKIKNKREYISIFVKKTDGKVIEEVMIPHDKDLVDYRSVMVDTVKKICYVEGRSEENLINDLLLPLADIIKIRIIRDDIDDGTIPLSDGFKFYENAKKMLLSTACDIIQPELYHKKLSFKQAQQFIEKCRFGQTEKGSFIASFICPFVIKKEDNLEQISIFGDKEDYENSFTREVTTRIMESIHYVKSSIDKGEENKLEIDSSEKTISSNFIESLVDMNLENKDTTIEFTTIWSPSVPQKRDLPKNIKLTNDYALVLREVVNKTKLVEKEKISTYFGKISQVKADVNMDKRTEGEIIFNFMESESKISKAKVILPADVYNKACKAHTLGQTVMIDGKLVEKGRSKEIKEPVFNIIDE